MNTEQKAKAYDEAIDKIADAVEAGTIEQGFAKWLFPKLKESEDEKVREALIELVKCNERSGYMVLNNVSIGSMLAWLEKQEGKHITEPQSRWWPSEKQMQILHRAVVAIAPGVVHDGLESLYNDLKNL